MNPSLFVVSANYTAGDARAGITCRLSFEVVRLGTHDNTTPHHAINFCVNRKGRNFNHRRDVARRIGFDVAPKIAGVAFGSASVAMLLSCWVEVA